MPTYATVMMVLTVLFLYGVTDPYFKNSESFLHEQVISRKYVTDTLQEKNQQLNALKAREIELLNASML